MDFRRSFIPGGERRKNAAVTEEATVTSEGAQELARARNRE